MVAPGMTCQYVVQFLPDCLGDFDDYILVETQSAHTLLIPSKTKTKSTAYNFISVSYCFRFILSL